MDIHRSAINGRPAYLILDSSEQVVELATDFMRSVALSTKNRADGTLELYAGKLRDFCAFLESHPILGQVRTDDAIVALSLPVIDEFYRACVARGLKTSTIRGYEVVIKLFTEWLSTEDAGKVHKVFLYEHTPFRTATPRRKMPRFLTPTQVVNLLQHMHWEVQRTATHFIYDTGVRISEVSRMRKSDLPDPSHYPAGQNYFPLFVHGSKGRGGETKERYTLISRPMLTRLHRYFRSRTYFTTHIWPEDQKPLFLNIYGDILTDYAIEAFISDAARRANMRGEASAHRLRHGTAYSVMRSNHGKTLLDNLVVVQKMFGHSDISTTEIYTDIPASAMLRITEPVDAPEIRTRLEEAEYILDETFLPEKKQATPRRIGRKK